MTKPRKTPEQLATEHWARLEPYFLEEMRMKMMLYIDGFTHGYKHGRREHDKVRTKPSS